MKKQLLTVGDSFTYGDELSDRYQAWPYQLADQLGYEVHNQGLSGSSNASIVRRTLEELAVNDYDLVVIGWTSPGRIEWKDDVGIAYNMWPGHAAAADFFADQPWRLELLNYISQHHNSAYLYEQYLIQVIGLQCYLQLHQIDYRMIDIRHSDYYRRVGAEQHDRLEAKVNTKTFVGWGKFGMIELTKHCPLGPGKHPLEKGHRLIANEIYKSLK